MGESEIVNNADLWVLSGSSDGVTWTEVIRSNNLNSPSSTRDGFLKMGSTAYLYWKVSHVTPTGSASAMGYWFYGWKVYDVIKQVKVISTGYPDSNTMVVDGGDWQGSDGTHSGTEFDGWNQDAPWHQYISSPDGSIDPNNPAINGFDGDTTTRIFSQSQGQTIRFAPPGGLAFTQGFKVYTGAFSGGITARVSGDNYTLHEKGTEVLDDVWVYSPMQSGTIEYIDVQGNGGLGMAYVYQYVVDDKMLVADSISGAPTDPVRSSSVEYQTNGGQGTIVEVNTDDNTLTIANTGDRDNRWIAENKAGTDFYVAGPEEVDSPLLTTNVWLESSAFSTTPATDAKGDPLDALKTITWSIKPDGGDEMIQQAGPSGTSNPYQPTGLTLNTWHTIKVKHEGLLLGESQGPWSTSTRFQTGASRTLKDHYMSRFLS